MLELLDRQKRLTVNQWKIVATANLGDLLDFFDFYLIGYALAFILKEWHLTYGESALILLASGVGAVPGAFFWGWMADKIGRRKVFILTTINVAIATGILALTPGPDGWVAGWLFLAFFRLFVGIGNRPLCSRFALGAGICPIAQARLDRRADDDDAAGGQPVGRAYGDLYRVKGWLARPLLGRTGADRAGVDDPLPGPGIATLADPHGAA